MLETEGSERFAIRVRDLVVGFRRHVVIDHLALDVRSGERFSAWSAPPAAASRC